VADISLKSNKIKESKCLYDKYLGVNTDTQLYGYYSHFELYGIVSILSNDYSQVSKILQQVFNPAITRNFEINALRGVLLHAKFSLATHSYDDALSWILEGFTSNQKSHYAPFDMQLRVLEVLCFIGKEDFEQAYKLSLRNQKYIYNKGNTEILDFYDRLFKLFMKILRKINSKKKIGSVEISTLKKLNSENIDLYAGLFSILQDKISLHNNKLNLHRF
jgi:hypothetical protein